MNPLDSIATALLIVGGVNWGLVGLREKDAVAGLFGRTFGETSTASRVVYALVGAAAIYSTARFAGLLKSGGSANGTIEESIELDVPVRAAYDQWTQFEEFPRFMQGVEEVRQLDDRRLHWVAQVAGNRREWDAVITEQRPDERIAWTSIDGARNAGVVTFHPLGDGRSRVMLQLDFEPRGPLERVGEVSGAVRTRARGDLDRFKRFIEERRQPTGGWRGEVERTTA